MRIRSLYLYFITVVISGFIGVLPAYAACVVPAGTVGDQMYNTSFNVMQYCDGTDWTAMRGDGGANAIDDLSDATTDYITDNNMFIGSGAGASIAVGGQNNLFIGEDTGTATTTGDNNVAMGYLALNASTISSSNIGIGPSALALYNSPTDGSMLAIGENALGAATDWAKKHRHWT